jgi:hypothetical protein
MPLPNLDGTGFWGRVGVKAGGASGETGLTWGQLQNGRMRILWLSP